jgi:hypothetical protein
MSLNFCFTNRFHNAVLFLITLSFATSLIQFRKLKSEPSVKINLKLFVVSAGYNYEEIFQTKAESVSIRNKPFKQISFTTSLHPISSTHTKCNSRAGSGPFCFALQGPSLHRSTAVQLLFLPNDQAPVLQPSSLLLPGTCA